MEYGSRIRRMDVMLIDPNTVSRGNLGALIRDFGCYLVRPFDDPEIAVVSILSKPPAVVLCNWGTDGAMVRQVLDQIRNHRNDEVARTPIIAVAQNLNRQITSNALKAGITQVLASPVVPADLMKKLIFVLTDQRQMLRREGRLTYVANLKKSKLIKPVPVPKVLEFPAASVTPTPRAADAEPDDVLEL
ncbi:MAG: hypothetical protein COA47_02465 [Robiginitomaculum sp.]|nr:MAG: hypothetical protein COA47_02465 [Robiginitomaculum sp.]